MDRQGKADKDRMGKARIGQDRLTRTGMDRRGRARKGKADVEWTGGVCSGMERRGRAMPTRPPKHKIPRVAGASTHTVTADHVRGTSTARGYNYRWQKYRDGFLARNPLCIECKALGRVTLATDVDHIKPVRDAPELFWEPSNHQPLCGTCHKRKTAKGL